MEVSEKEAKNKKQISAQKKKPPKKKQNQKKKKKGSSKKKSLVNQDVSLRVKHLLNCARLADSEYKLPFMENYYLRLLKAVAQKRVLRLEKDIKSAFSKKSCLLYHYKLKEDGTKQVFCK